jgi:hypothetical protein
MMVSLVGGAGTPLTKEAATRLDALLRGRHAEKLRAFATPRTPSTALLLTTPAA